ncbi:hypothetical protein Tco_1162325 [Tanacetum coccineum]
MHGLYVNIGMFSCYKWFCDGDIEICKLSQGDQPAISTACLVDGNNLEDVEVRKSGYGVGTLAHSVGTDTPYLLDGYSVLRIVLSVKDKLDYLEQPIPLVPIPAQAGQQVAPEALAAHAAWVKGSKEIVGLMLMTMELVI